MDRKWRNAIKTRACLYLFNHGAADVGTALFYASIESVVPDEGGTQHAAISVRSFSDLRTLRDATRSHTGSDMPGFLDQAFEDALPGHEWPIFYFGVLNATAEEVA